MTIRSRLRDACRTNDAQMSSVTIFTLMNLVAALTENASWPILLFAAMFWPVVAFVINLMMPLPEQKQ